MKDMSQSSIIFDKTYIGIKSTLVLEEQYVQTILGWDKCSDDDVQALKEFLGHALNTSIGPLFVSQASGMIYILHPIGSDTVIAVHKKTGQLGVIDISGIGFDEFTDQLDVKNKFIIFED